MTLFLIRYALGAYVRRAMPDVGLILVGLILMLVPVRLAHQNIDEEDFEEEQNLVARLVHHLACPNSEGQYRVLLAARRHFGQGGPKRLRHTLPPLIFSGLQLVRQLHAQSADGEGAAQLHQKVACCCNALLLC
jgi:hypothetical protein